MNYDLVVIGAGAGGCYAAIRAAEFQKGIKACVLEAAKRPLSKVEISGGGRCNVTHACYDPAELVTYYPRGEKDLLQSFAEFHPGHLVDWFKEKGVILKTEADGRMFPVTDSSSTIINCFLSQMKRLGIQLWNSTRAVKFEYNDSLKRWSITLFDGRQLTSRYLLISTGSDQRIWDSLKSMDYNIIPPVPSLFTFNIRDKALQELMGISKNDAHVSIPKMNLEATGPLLITHWGLSGPAVLRLSAWGARELYDCGYVFDLKVNWVGKENAEAFLVFLQKLINENPKKQISKLVIKDFPARLWKYICVRAEIPEFMSGAEFGRKPLQRLSNVLTNDIYRVTGKSTFKEEFVTAGGVDLSQINMTTFESKKHPGLYMVGEVLNIDAITGGFNFQAAWTGGFLAAKFISEQI